MAVPPDGREPPDHYGTALAWATRMGHPYPEVTAALVAQLAEAMDRYIGRVFSSDTVMATRGKDTVP